MALCLPAIYALKAAFPLADIHMICSPKNEQLVRMIPIVSKHLSIDIDRCSTQEKRQFKQQLRNENYTIMINFWGHSFFEQLVSFLNPSVSIGPITGMRSSWVYSHPVALPWSHVFHHETDYNLMLVAPLRVVGSPSLSLPCSIKKEDKAGKTVLIFCSAGDSNLALSDRMIQALVERILDMPSYRVVLTYGSISENSELLTLAGPSIINKTQPLSLDALVACIQQADVYIGPDTGPSHLAALFNKPAVVVFRNHQNLPIRWGPQSDQFRCIRSRFVGEAGESIDVDAIVDAMIAIQTEAPWTHTQKRYHHCQTSLRLCVEITNTVADRHAIARMRAQGWVVVPHIRRPGIKQWIRLKRKISQRQVNVFVAPKKSWWHYCLAYYFHVQCKPTPVIVHPDAFDSLIQSNIQPFNASEC